MLRGRQPNPDLEKIYFAAKETLRPLFELCSQPQADFRALITRTIFVPPEQLAADDLLSGAERLWQGDDGEKPPALFSDLLENVGTLPSVPGSQYGKFIEALDGCPHGPSEIRNPSVPENTRSIEARLTGFDTVVIGGCQRSEPWPTAAPAGAWLSRPMKKGFSFRCRKKNIGVFLGTRFCLTC